MKKIVGIFLCLIISCSEPGKSISAIEKELNYSFQRIQYWHDTNHHESAYDSLYAANRKFEKLLYQYGSNPLTLRHDFKSLKKNGLVVSTSEDGKFRIYSWNTLTGGTMQFYRNVFQYESGKKVRAEISKSNMEYDSECTYYQINDIIAQDKKYYIAQNSAVYSNALQYITVKAFSIENNTLNSNARLFKTSTGIENELSCELDFSASVNHNQPMTFEDAQNLNIQYDPKKKIISIPLILDDSKITAKRVRYQFKDKYFEKI